MGWFGGGGGGIRLDKRIKEGSWTAGLIDIICDFELKKRKFEFDMPGVDEDGLKAFVAPTVYVMLSDRARQPEEEIQLLAMLVTSPPLRDTTPAQFGALIKDVIDTLRGKSGTTLEQRMREALRAMPRGMNESAYAYAVRVSYADQLQTEEEKQALEALQSWMQIPAELARSIDTTMRLLVAAPKVV